MNAQMVKEVFSSVTDERKVVVWIDSFEHEIEMIGYGAKTDEAGRPYSYIAIVAKSYDQE